MSGISFNINVMQNIVVALKVENVNHLKELSKRYALMEGMPLRKFFE